MYVLKIFKGRRLIFNSRTNLMAHLPVVTHKNADRLRLVLTPAPVGMSCYQAITVYQQLLRDIKANTAFQRPSIYFEIQYWRQDGLEAGMVESGFCRHHFISVVNDLIREIDHRSVIHDETYLHAEICYRHSK